MEPFSRSGKQVQFSSVTGKVVSSSKRSDTYINTSYSSGTTSSGDRYSIPHVTSNVVVKQEFFLLTEDGREVPIQLSGVDIPVRDGQTVTMIAGGVHPDRRDNYWVRMAVHDTGRYYAVNDDGRRRHKWKLVSTTRWVLTLLSLMFIGTILFFGMIVTAFVGSSSALGFRTLWFLSVLGTLGWLFVSIRGYRDLKRRLGVHLDMLSRNVLAAKPRILA